MIATAVVDAAIIKQLGSFFSTEAHKDTDRVRYINSAVRSIVTSKNFSFNRYIYDITTVSGTTDYQIPFQIETFGILNSSGDEVTTMDFEDYYLTKNKDNLIGIWDNSFITTLVGDFRILYRGYPPTITDLSGSIAIPEHFLDILVTKAVAFGFADIKDYVKEGQKENIFNGMIKSMATRNSNRMPRKIKMVGAEQAW